MTDARLPRTRDENGELHNGHTLVPVYSTLLRQIARDYAGLPEAGALTLGQIRFFYEGVRHEISKHKRA